eukprot:10957174-Heterocapsa_arctica.AAC.1
MPDFAVANCAYARTCLARSPHEHSGILLQQIIEERNLGRMYGPYKAPAAWGRTAVPLRPELQEPCDVACPL